MIYKNGTPYSDEQWKAWYGRKSSDEIDPEAEQEKVDILIDQLNEDGYHSHGGRR